VLVIIFYLNLKDSKQQKDHPLTQS
jgi:hypothetical protein